MSARNREQMGAKKESHTLDQEEADEVSRSLNGSAQAELHCEGRCAAWTLKASQSDVLKSRLYIIIYPHHSSMATQSTEML